MEKVKDVISENETLTEQAKFNWPRSDSSEGSCNEYAYRNSSATKDHQNSNATFGPNIVLESRISELEAQLAQAEMDVKKLAQENSAQKSRIAGTFNEPGSADIYKTQVDILQR